jgi:hypothetical protein
VNLDEAAPSEVAPVGGRYEMGAAGVLAGQGSLL